MTGIRQDTIRIWERRYSAVVPERTEGQRRVYSEEDVERLGLIKRLVDRGHAISEVATLDTHELQARLWSHEQVPTETAASGPMQVLLVGPDLATLDTGTSRLSPLAEVRASVATETELDGHPALDEGVDLLVVERPSLLPGGLAELDAFAARVGARATLVVYCFAAGEALFGLRQRGIHTVRGPLARADLIEAVGAAAARLHAGEPGPTPTQSSLRPPRFDDEALARLSSIRTDIDCECPKQVSSLLRSLRAFERYSQECESRTPDDAAIHRMLATATGEARTTLEDALEILLEAESIEVDRL